MEVQETEESKSEFKNDKSLVINIRYCSWSYKNLNPIILVCINGPGILIQGYLLKN